MEALLGELNNALKDYKRMCQDLDRAVQSTQMHTALNVGLSQCKYIAQKVDQFISELPMDKEEEPIIPVNGELVLVEA